jgi:hypothetical protein
MGQAVRATETPGMGPNLVLFELAIIGAVLISLGLIVRIVRNAL